MKKPQLFVFSAFISVLILLSCKKIAAQDSLLFADKKNTVYISAFDYALPFVVYYDRIIHDGNWFKLSLGGGLGSDAFYKTQLFVPAEFNLLVGKQKNFFEVGTGTISVLFYNQTPLETYTTLKFGYRRQKPEGGFFMRASIIIITFFMLEVSNDGVFDFRLHRDPFPSLALGAGYTF